MGEKRGEERNTLRRRGGEYGEGEVTMEEGEVTVREGEVTMR